MTAAQPRSRGGPSDPSHDADLRRGILHTTIARPVAALMMATFLVMIAAVPVSQAIAERIKGDDSVLPDLFRRVPTRATLKGFEEDLDKASYARDWVRPRAQALLTRFGGFGNTKAVLGKEPGWLFYQPGVAAVGGPGFLDGEILEARAKAALSDGGGALQPDPRPAILDFHRYLTGRGIALVLFPVPDKAGLQPAELHGRVARAQASPRGENPDQARLFAELARAGVLIFDPDPHARIPAAPPLYLAQDTHWTPAWMEAVAAQLAEFLGQRKLLPPATCAPRWRSVARQVSRVGDIVDMIGLPEGQTLYEPQTVTIHEVHGSNCAGGDSDAATTTADSASDDLFAPDPRGDLLLLGDSFSNVFTLAPMGWGEGAGFAPHLAQALGRGIDVIAQNDAGAHATRTLLGNALAGGEDRLAGKKVVIWEFASRELAVGDWKPVAWPTRTTDAKPETTTP